MKNFWLGFGYALNGIRAMLQTERNFKVQILVFVLVLISGIYFKISSTEWLAIFGISALVLGLETVNTAIEKLCDLYTLDQHPQIKLIKDIAAGAVLIAAIFAITIGILIFSNYIKF